MNLDLLLQSGPMGQFILMTLLCLSLFCWALVFSKWKQFEAQIKQNKKFLSLFLSLREKKMEELVLSSRKLHQSCLAALFQAGIDELQKQATDEGPFHTREQLEQLERVLYQASLEQTLLLERGLSGFATLASAAPFIGLFGTVWGIMNAFQKIGATGTAHLGTVAPGISEALITTAAGIGAAIPAVIAYNYFSGKMRLLLAGMDGFSQELMNFVQKNFLRKYPKGQT